MIFYHYKESGEMLENEFLEGKLDNLLESIHEDHEVFESKDMVAEDTFDESPELYEPMTKADQEVIDKLWSDFAKDMIK